MALGDRWISLSSISMGSRAPHENFFSVVLSVPSVSPWLGLDHDTKRARLGFIRRYLARDSTSLDSNAGGASYT